MTAASKLRRSDQTLATVSRVARHDGSLNMEDQRHPTIGDRARLLTCAHRLKRLAAVAILVLVASRGGSQSLAPSLLKIEVRNHTLYVYDADQSQWATTPAKLTRQAPRTFESWI